MGHRSEDSRNQTRTLSVATSRVLTGQNYWEVPFLNDGSRSFTPNVHRQPTVKEVPERVDVSKRRGPVRKEPRWSRTLNHFVPIFDSGPMKPG